MSSIFNTLSIGYTGLNAAQVGIDTTGHNITNAESSGYTRQRVVSSAAIPISSGPGLVGNGAKIDDIKRVFDNFVFDKYNDVSSQKEYIDYEQKNLKQLSTYFPEIDGVGIKAELAEYYNSWQTFSDNPDNDAIKMALAKQTESLSKHIAFTQNQVKDLQNQINEDIVVSVNEVNDLAKELASLNVSIEVAESAGGYSANDLRDRRNVIEQSISKLIGGTVSSTKITSNIALDSNSNTKTGSYTINVAGFNIVDGGNYHPIHVSNEKNPNGFYEISYKRQDGVFLEMEDNIKGGKVGSMLNLRGRSVDTTSGVPTDGIIQNTVSQLDSFAKHLIETTNNLYAQTPVTRMQSNIVNMNEEDTLLTSPLNLQAGAFEIVVYDLDGNEAAARTIKINDLTVMNGESGSNSIQGQIFAQIDDNNNANANDDIDNYFKNGFNFKPSQTGELRLELNLDPLAESRGYTFSIRDVLKDSRYESGTNFAGALGLNRFFDGDDAQSIKLYSDFMDNPTLMSASTTATTGDSSLALQMIQHQFETYDFTVGTDNFNTTAYGMFDIIATQIGTATNQAISKGETMTTQFNAAELEYFSTSKVSIDEEMANLIRYQTSYSASAKIITTIDQMMQTLLGIKQ